MSQAPPTSTAKPTEAAAPAPAPAAATAAAAPAPAPGTPTATPAAPAPSRLTEKPAILIIGEDPIQTPILTKAIVSMDRPFAVCENAIRAWKYLARNDVGLIIMNHIEGPIKLPEFLFMIRNDNEFTKIPILLNGLSFNDEEKQFATWADLPYWIRMQSTEEALKKMIESYYGRKNIVTNLLTESRFVERKIRSLYIGTNLYIKASHDSHSFLRRLETSSPDLVMIDLRFAGDSILNIIKLINEDENWARLPVLAIAPANHNLIRAVNDMGISQVIHEGFPKSEAKRIIPLICKRPFFESPLYAEWTKARTAA